MLQTRRLWSAGLLKPRTVPKKGAPYQIMHRLKPLVRELQFNEWGSFTCNVSQFERMNTKSTRTNRYLQQQARLAHTGVYPKRERRRVNWVWLALKDEVDYTHHQWLCTWKGTRRTWLASPRTTTTTPTIWWFRFLHLWSQVTKDILCVCVRTVEYPPPRLVGSQKNIINYFKVI